MPNLSISITEQPTEFHRFRYETEVTGGKLGGLLYGRHGNKSCVRLKVTGIDPLVHNAVIVIGGTVNPDGFPHPFFMVGENCSDGAYQFRKEVSTLGDKRELEISLEKVSLVCVSTKGEKLVEAINNRKRINFNPCNKDMDTVKYSARNLKSVRLAFQVYYHNFDNQAVCTTAIVVSDVITDAKQQAKLGIYGVHPNTLSVSGTQELWIYFDDALPHLDKGLYSVEIRPSDEDTSSAKCKVKEVKKHLIIAQKPEISTLFGGGDERIKCDLVVTESRSSLTDSQDVMLHSANKFGEINIADFLKEIEPAQKRKRAIATTSLPVEELLSYPDL